MEFIALVLALAITALIFLVVRYDRRKTAAESAKTPVESPVQRRSVLVPVAKPAEREVVSSEYLHSSKWDELLVLGDDGMPPLSLAVHRGEWWLRENTTGLLVGVANRLLPRLGVWTVHVRGIVNYKPAVRAGDFRPGTVVDLVREPGNAYDTNALAVRARGSDRPVGYYNKGMAARLAIMLDRGDSLVAISLAGEPAGENTGGRISVLAASPRVLDHLIRDI